MNALEKKKLLLVDDEKIQLDLFELLLSKFNYNIEKAENGREALQKVREYSPDLILLDNMMPFLNGWEVTRVIKCSPDFIQWRTTPIIMFSAADMVQKKVEGFTLGIEDYITKPYHFAEVLARIQTVLRTQEAAKQLKECEKKLEDEYLLNARLLRRIDELSIMMQSIPQTIDTIQKSRELQRADMFAIPTLM